MKTPPGSQETDIGDQETNLAGGQQALVPWNSKKSGLFSRFLRQWAKLRSPHGHSGPAAETQLSFPGPSHGVAAKPRKRSRVHFDLSLILSYQLLI